MDARTFTRPRGQASRETTSIRAQIALAALNIVRMALALLAESDPPPSEHDGVKPEGRTARPPAPFERFDLELDLPDS